MVFEKKKMSLCKVHIADSSATPPLLTLEPGQSITIAMKFVVCVSVSIGAILRLLPYEFIDGNPVPTVIFQGHALMFYCLVISIIFAFTGSFSSLLMGNKSKFATFSRCYAMISLASALSILVYALFLDSFRWFSQGKQIMAE